MSNNIDETVFKIKELIEKINYSKIILIGGSMGGYGALLFGSLIKCDSILAISPQTFIDKNNRIVYKDTRWQNEINRLYCNNTDKKYYDLSSLNFNSCRNNICYE